MSQPPDSPAPGTITISRAKYAELMNDSLLLEALRQSGVDNWGWYGDAYAQYEEWKNDPAVQDPDNEAGTT